MSGRNPVTIPSAFDYDNLFHLPRKFCLFLFWVQNHLLVICAKAAFSSNACKVSREVQRSGSSGFMSHHCHQLCESFNHSMLHFGHLWSKSKNSHLTYFKSMTWGPTYIMNIKIFCNFEYCILNSGTISSNKSNIDLNCTLL